MTELFSSDLIEKVPDIVGQHIQTTLNKYKTVAISSIITATILLVSLAWENVIRTIIEYYFPDANSNVFEIIFFSVSSLPNCKSNLYL